MAFSLDFRDFPSEKAVFQYADVPWDRELYGLPCYEIRWRTEAAQEAASAWSAWQRDLPEDCPIFAYTRLATGEAGLSQALTHCAFYLVETTLDLSAALRRLTPIVRLIPGYVRLRLAEEADLPGIEAIARTAFSSDRLHLDPHLSPQASDERYVRWVRTGFRSGEPVHVLQDANSSTVRGFFHLRSAGPEKETVELSLAAVEPSCQGSGLGAWMFQEVLMECRRQGFRRATVRVSANNPDALNLYLRLGFGLERAFHTFHWYREGLGNGAK